MDGFIIEGPTAGGHNAPPRGKPQLSAAASPSTASATSWISRRCASSACRSGSRAGAGRPRGCGTRSRAAPPASRSGPRSRTATSRASTRRLRRASSQLAAAGRGARVHGSRRVAHGLPVQGRPARGDDLVRGRVPRAHAHLRSRLPARAVPEGRRHDGLPLRVRAGRELRLEGRRGRERAGPQVPVQRPHGGHRPPADAGRPRREDARHVGRRRRGRRAVPAPGRRVVRRRGRRRRGCSKRSDEEEITESREEREIS